MSAIYFANRRLYQAQLKAWRHSQSISTEADGAVSLRIATLALPVPKAHLVKHKRDRLKMVEKPELLSHAQVL